MSAPIRFGLNHLTPFESTTNILGYPISSGPPAAGQTVIFDTVTQQFRFELPTTLGISMFSAKSFVAQQIPGPNIPTYMDAPDVVYNINGDYDDVNKFTCSIPGYYQFTVAASSSSVTNQYFNTALYKNGSLFIDMNTTNQPNDQLNRGTTTIYLDLGDTIQIVCVVTTQSPARVLEFSGFLIKTD